MTLHLNESKLRQSLRRQKLQKTRSQRVESSKHNLSLISCRQQTKVGRLVLGRSDNPTWSQMRMSLWLTRPRIWAYTIQDTSCLLRSTLQLIWKDYWSINERLRSLLILWPNHQQDFSFWRVHQVVVKAHLSKLLLVNVTLRCESSNPHQVWMSTISIEDHQQILFMINKKSLNHDLRMMLTTYSTSLNKVTIKRKSFNFIVDKRIEARTIGQPSHVGETMMRTSQRKRLMLESPQCKRRKCYWLMAYLKVWRLIRLRSLSFLKISTHVWRRSYSLPPQTLLLSNWVMWKRGKRTSWRRYSIPQFWTAMIEQWRNLTSTMSLSQPYVNVFERYETWKVWMLTMTLLMK